MRECILLTSRAVRRPAFRQLVRASAARIGEMHLSRRNLSHLRGTPHEIGDQLGQFLDGFLRLVILALVVIVILPRALVAWI
jgi:hypothetical protein